MNWSWVKVAFLCGFITALIFSMASLVFYFDEWDRLFFVASLGLFVGLVAAPEIDPKVFKTAWLFQMTSGLAAGGLIACLLIRAKPRELF